jgi:hypothetical protein
MGKPNSRRARRRARGRDYAYYNRWYDFFYDWDVGVLGPHPAWVERVAQTLFAIEKRRGGSVYFQQRCWLLADGAGD